MSDAFIRALAAEPKDNDSRLVYADWLEERGEPNDHLKAEYLRLTASPEPFSKGKRKVRRKRLHELATKLGADWLAVVSRLSVENCPVTKAKRERVPLGVNFYFECSKNWADLTATADQTKRFCQDCKKTVHYCSTVTQARRLAHANECVALDLSLFRHEGDLAPPMETMMVGVLATDDL